VHESTVHRLVKLKRRLGRLAGWSEASLIREPIQRLTATEGLRPTTPLFPSNDPHLAERVDGP